MQRPDIETAASLSSFIALIVIIIDIVSFRHRIAPDTTD
jgi:hypothetical protein